MAMWEPFNDPARHAIVRAQEVAQMFASHFIGTEHIAFALAEADDEVGRIMATAIDRNAIRERLGGAASAPTSEMVFTPGAKRTIELAFENARRLDHRYIGEAHLALGVLGSNDRPPLVAGVEVTELRAALDRAGQAEESSTLHWKRSAGEDDPHPVAASIVQMLLRYPDLSKTGTAVKVTIQPAGGVERTWSYLREDERP